MVQNRRYPFTMRDLLTQLGMYELELELEL